MLGVGRVLTYAAAPRSLRVFVAEFRRIFHPAEHSLPLSLPGLTCWEAGVVYIYKNIPGPPKPYRFSLFTTLTRALLTSSEY